MRSEKSVLGVLIFFRQLEFLTVGKHTSTYGYLPIPCFPESLRFRKPSEAKGNSDRFLKRTMLEEEWKRNHPLDSRTPAFCCDPCFETCLQREPGESETGVVEAFMSNLNGWFSKFEVPEPQLKRATAFGFPANPPKRLPSKTLKMDSSEPQQEFGSALNFGSH